MEDSQLRTIRLKILDDLEELFEHGEVHGESDIVTVINRGFGHDL